MQIWRIVNDQLEECWIKAKLSNKISCMINKMTENAIMKTNLIGELKIKIYLLY